MRIILLIASLFSMLPLLGQERDMLQPIPKFVSDKVDDIYVDTTSGTAWITIGGDSSAYEFDPPDYPIIINDDDGNQYTIHIWPPANGGFNIVDNVPIKAGQKFDRYGNAFGNTPKGNPNLGGSFTSPVNNTPYNFGERALNGAENSYDFYYEIEVLQDLPFTAQNADVIPWFGKPGGGKQSMWDIPVNPNSTQGYSYTLSELAEMGMIKITIKDSPSGNFTNLVNTVIQ